MHDRWLCRVVDGLYRLHGEFHNNELAYLALTSKVERPIVDRLAYSLHRDHGIVEDVAIAREFTILNGTKRVDLAIIENSKPCLFLEAKAMRLAKVFSPSGRSEYCKKIRSDLNKLRNYKPRSGQTKLTRLALLLVTYVDGSPAKELDGVVKYAGSIRNAHNKYISSEGIADMKTQLHESFPADQFCCVESGKGDIDGGCAFGLCVKVHFLLYRLS